MCAVATECQALAASFSDEQTAEALTITDKLRAIFQPPALASTAVAEPVPLLEFLSIVLPELMSIIMDTHALACLAATCCSLWCSAPTHPPPPLPTPGLVETELRRRAEARGLHTGSSLPAGALSWVPYLLKRGFHDVLGREAPLAVGDICGGSPHSLFVDGEGRMHLACRRKDIDAWKVGNLSQGTTGAWMPTISLCLPRPR